MTYRTLQESMISIYYWLTSGAVCSKYKASQKFDQRAEFEENPGILGVWWHYIYKTKLLSKPPTEAIWFDSDMPLFGERHSQSGTWELLLAMLNNLMYSFRRSTLSDARSKFLIATLRHCKEHPWFDSSTSCESKPPAIQALLDLQMERGFLVCPFERQKATLESFLYQNLYFRHAEGQASDFIKLRSCVLISPWQRCY